MTRRLVIALGLIFLLGGGFFWWRVTHPPLSDAEQIAANLEDIREALENGNIERALNYLSEDAKFAGQSRSQIRSQFTIGQFMNRADVRVTFTNTRHEVQGATASTKGHYKLDVRQRVNPDSYDGDFSLEWQKQDGQWKISDGSASGDIPN
jgi:ketosteroid isomerase-like protein